MLVNRVEGDVQTVLAIDVDLIAVPDVSGLDRSGPDDLQRLSLGRGEFDIRVRVEVIGIGEEHLLAGQIHRLRPFGGLL